MKEQIFYLLGGGGFIGSNFQEQFPDNKYLIYDLQFNYHNPNNTYFRIDLSKINFTKDDIEVLDIHKFDKENIVNVLVLAANLGIFKVINDNQYLDNEILLQEKQVQFVKELCNYYKEVNVVYFSTSEIYGDISLMKEDGVNQIHLKEDFYKRRRYATTKLLYEDRYLELKDNYKNLNLLIIRPFNVVGKYQNPNFVIPKMIIDGKLNQKIEVYNGSQERSFIHVYDFNNYLIFLLKKIKEINSDKYNYYSFNIANLKNHVKIRFLAQIIQKILYEKFNFDCEIDIQNKDKNIIGTKSRIPDLSRLFEITNYLPEKDLRDIINELVEFY